MYYFKPIFQWIEFSVSSHRGNVSEPIATDPIPEPSASHFTTAYTYVYIYIYIFLIFWFRRKCVDSSPPSAAYMRQWYGSSLVQVMACRLFGAKPLPEPMLPYCQLDSWEHISVELVSEFYHFCSRKCNWYCRLPKQLPFCPGGRWVNMHGRIWMITYGRIQIVVVAATAIVTVLYCYCHYFCWHYVFVIILTLVPLPQIIIVLIIVSLLLPLFLSLSWLVSSLLSVALVVVVLTPVSLFTLCHSLASVLPLALLSQTRVSVSFYFFTFVVLCSCHC